LAATMDEGSERDKTWGRGGLPTLPGLYHSTIQPSRGGFFWVHKCVWRERKPEAEFLNFYVTVGNIMYLTDASRFLISCVIQHYAPVVVRS
jgi:hypothetical protein